MTVYTGAVQQQLLGLSVTPGSAASVVATAKGSAPIHQVQVMRPKQVQLRPTIQVSLPVPQCIVAGLLSDVHNDKQELECINYNFVISNGGSSHK